MCEEAKPTISLMTNEMMDKTSEYVKVQKRKGSGRGGGVKIVQVIDSQARVNNRDSQGSTPARQADLLPEAGFTRRTHLSSFLPSFRPAGLQYQVYL